MKSFSEMTADEIAAYRAAWRKGEAELWRGTTSRPSNLRRSDGSREKPVYSDHDAPSEAICAQQMSRCVSGVPGAGWVNGPQKVLPLFGDKS